MAFHTWSRFETPPVTEVIDLPGHASRRALTNPKALADKVAPLLRPAAEFFTVDIGGVTLDGWMLKPPAFDAAKKYPVIVHVYGEPAGQTVLDGWGGGTLLFHRALADAGYVVVSVDNRGTPAPKGAAWRKMVYGTVGDLSSRDQAAAVRALTARHPYLDATRVGVWGWSGGGSNTLNTMFRFPDVFQVGVSVAPVPDQKLYDTIYQERYMGLPQDNAEGYRVGSPINFAEGLKGTLARHARHGRRQRALPGHRAAHQPADRAAEARGRDGVSQPDARDQRGPRNERAHLPRHREVFPGAPAARPEIASRRAPG